MSGLVLKLAPHERLLINGAVIENGDRRSRMHILTPDTKVLRMKDALHPEEVKTPVRRVCYIAQLVLSGDVELEEARPQLQRGIDQLGQVFGDANSRQHLDLARTAVAEGQVYKAMKALRALIGREDRLIAGS